MLFSALALAACSDAQPTTRPVRTAEELIATLEALPPAPTRTATELAQQKANQALADEWMEETATMLAEEYPALFSTPTPDPRYRGCDQEVENYHTAMANYYESGATLYLAGSDRETVTEEYFYALDALGSCLGRRQ